MDNTNLTGFEVAVVGMSARFPGADDIASFWNNLLEGKESINFLSDDELKDLAKSSTHTTAKQAATIAKDANVGKLIIGHFSSRYKDLTPLKEEAMEVFENVDLALDNQQYFIE